VEELHRRLNRQGARISEAEVWRCAHHQVHFPQNKDKVLHAIANIGKVKCTKEELNAIANAQATIQELHGRMGKLLRMLLLTKRAGHDIQTKIQDDMIDTDLLDSLIRVEEVDTVHHKAKEADTGYTEPLREILQRLAQGSHGRLVATNAALKSADDSPFQDLARAEKCFDLLSNQYYWVFQKDKRIKLAQANDAAKPYQIEYKGDSSEKTMYHFKNEYLKIYKGVQIEAGRHLSIGSSRDPKYCFRVYFHWDEDDQQLVIHHAGKHKSTSLG